MTSLPPRDERCCTHFAHTLFLAGALALCVVSQVPAQGPASLPAEADASAGQAQLTWQKFPAEFADYYCTQGIPTVFFDTKPDFCRSDDAIFADARETRLATTLVIDASGGTDSDYDTLYVDLNRDGKYTDDPVYKAEPFEGYRGPDRQAVRAYFPNVTMPRRSVPGVKSRVQVFLGEYNCAVIPQQWAVGQVSVGGRKMPAALIDADWNDDVANPGGYQPGQAPDAAPGGDYLILGINGEKELRPATSVFVPGEGGSARGFLTRYLVLDSGTYEIKASQLAGGAKLELTPVQLPTGTVKMTSKPRTSHVMLMGQSTCVLRSGRPTELAVPADTYLFMHETYSETVVPVKQGQQVEVDPRPRRERMADAEVPAAKEPSAAPVLSPSPAEPADAWTIYVRQFIATYKLDMPQQAQAWSILKNLKARAQEYRASHKAEYDAVGKIADKAQRDRDLQALDGPINQIFEELKTRLAEVPTEAQRAAVSPSTQEGRSTSTQKSRPASTQPTAAGKER